MLDELKNITEDPKEMKPHQTEASVRWGSAVVLALCLLVVIGLLRFVAHHTDADGSLSLSAQSVRLALTSLFPSFVKLAVALVLGFGWAHGIENTKLGQRSHYLLPAILLGACIVFAAGA